MVCFVSFSVSIWPEAMNAAIPAASNESMIAMRMSFVFLTDWEPYPVEVRTVPEGSLCPQNGQVPCDLS